MKRFLAAPALLFVTACSGGSGNGYPVAPLPQSSTTPPTGDSSLSIRLFIPATAPTSVQSLTISQNGAAIATIAVNSKSACSTIANGRVCSATASAAIGENQTFLIRTFASATSTGAPLSTATIVETIEVAKTTSLDLALSGNLTAVNVAFGIPALPYGQRASVPLYVNAIDASGNVIVGPGIYVGANGIAAPISLGESDAVGAAATLSQTTIVQPGTNVSLAYSGAAVDSATVFAAATGASGATVVERIECIAAPTSEALFVGANVAAHTTSVESYGIRANGQITPGSSALVTPFSNFFISGLAVDARGVVELGESTFFGTTTATAMLSYCPNAPENAPPRHGFTLTGLDASDGESLDPWLSTDAVGNVYTLTNDTLTEYPAGAGPPGVPKSTTTAPPAVKIITGAATGLDDALGGVAVAPDGTAYVANAVGYGQAPSSLTDAVVGFAPSANGNSAPESILKNTAGGLLTPISLALDTAKNVYVLYQSNNISSQSDFGPFAIAEFAAANQRTPVRVISGSNTRIGTVNGAAGAPVSIAVSGDGTILVANATETSSDIDAFGTTAVGNVAPTSSIVRSASGAISAMAVDTNGDIYTATGYVGQLFEYDRHGTQLREIEGPATGFGITEGIAVDADGNVSVSSFNNFTSGAAESSSTSTGVTGILTFGPNQSGDVAPIRTLTPSGFSAGGLAYDASGRLYAVDIMAPEDGAALPNTQIGSFDPGASGTQRPRAFNDSNAFLRDYTGAIAADAAGDIYATAVAENTVFAYPAGSEGAVAPVLTYNDTVASTLGPAVSLDSHGTSYVSSCESNSVSVYPAGSTTPSRTISGSHTHIVCPARIVADSSGAVYLYPSFNTSDILVFSGTATGDAAPIEDIPGFNTSFAIGPGTGPQFGPAPGTNSRVTSARNIRRNAGMIAACSDKFRSPAWCAEVFQRTAGRLNDRSR